MKNTQTDDESKLKLLLGSPLRYKPTGVDVVEIHYSSRPEDKFGHNKNITVYAKDAGGYGFEIPQWKEQNSSSLCDLMFEIKHTFRGNEPPPHSWTYCLHCLEFNFAKMSFSYTEKYIKHIDELAHSGLIHIDEFFKIGSE